MKLTTVALDYSDPIEEFKKLNIEDTNGSQEDGDDLVHNLSDDLNNLNINNNRQLTERGKVKREPNLEVRSDPYKKNDFGRHRNDSVDSGNCSDASINSPASTSSESIIAPFEENTSTKLVSLDGWQEKNLQKFSQRSFPVQCAGPPRRQLQTLAKLDLVSNKTEEKTESVKISNSEKKVSNLENTNTVKTVLTATEELTQQLNRKVLVQKWLDLIVFSKEDIFTIDSEGRTIFHRLLNTHEDDHLPEALFTVMEEAKQHPSKCKVLLDAEDAILNTLRCFEGNTDILENYFKISFIVISLLYDYEKIEKLALPLS